TRFDCDWSSDVCSSDLQAAASRPRLLQAVYDAIQQPDIRKKLLFTGAMLVVFRFVAHVPIPGADPRALEAAFNSNRLLGFFNLRSEERRVGKESSTRWT